MSIDRTLTWEERTAIGFNLERLVKKVDEGRWSAFSGRTSSAG